MLTSNDINVIGNIINTSWCKSSTERGSFPLGTAQPMSITAKLVPMQGPPLDLPKDVIARERVPGINGDGSEQFFVINYTDLVSFRSGFEVQAEVKRCREIAERICAAKIKAMKAEFKGATGRALRLKYKEGHDSVETAYAPTPAISLIAVPRITPELYRGFYRYTGIYIIS